MENKSAFQERIQNSAFEFTNASRFPGVEVGSAKSGVYFTALLRTPDSDRIALYFINRSEEPLNSVTIKQLGGFYVEGTESSGEQKVPTYENVAPNEAVKIDTYDEISDSDYSFNGTIEIVKLGGESQSFKYSGKGVPNPQCFVWKEL